MRTDDINALAGQRADKKGGNMKQHSQQRGARGIRVALPTSKSCHSQVSVACVNLIAGDVWTSFYDKVKEVKDGWQAVASLKTQSRSSVSHPHE